MKQVTPKYSSGSSDRSLAKLEDQSSSPALRQKFLPLRDRVEKIENLSH